MTILIKVRVTRVNGLYYTMQWLHKIAESGLLSLIYLLKTGSKKI
jgi:hypothetical protein